MIDDLRKKFHRQEYEYTLHAVDQSILKHITRKEIEEAIDKGEIIEDYPTDKFGPSCLVFRLTIARKPLHIQCTYPSKPKVKIITIYEPDPAEWIDFKIRRKK